MALCIGLAMESAQAQSIPVDRPTNVSGVTVACTGIGNREESEARWSNYPLKLQAVGGYGQYLGNQDVTLRGNDGSEIANVNCVGPWVLMRVQPGRYQATVTVPNAPSKDVNFTVPANGQRDVIVRFPGLMNGKESTQAS
jgi:hypothetical protein